MALPLFRLPILVIKLILETMGFIEIFVLASTSSDTKRIIKNLVRIRNHEMIILMEKECFVFHFQSKTIPDFCAPIYMNSKECFKPKNVFHMKIGDMYHVPSEFHRANDDTIILTIYWNHTVDHGTALYTALLEVFRIPQKGIIMNLNNVAVENCRSWINWNNDYFPDNSFLEITGTCSFHDYTWILKNVRTKHKLFLRVEPSGYPESPENIEILKFEVPIIIIHHGKWIKPQQLKAFKAEEIIVNSASLTDAQINTFLRDWMNSEEASMLKQLTIRFNREADSEVVLEGMDATDEDLMKPEDALSQWSFKMANGERCTVIYAEYEENVQTFGFEFIVGK
ncbi:unnamed protein product [Caenorhabditis brenneri]